jgi:hypothetical protein
MKKPVLNYFVLLREKQQIHTVFWLEDLEGIDHSEDLEMDGG